MGEQPKNPATGQQMGNLEVRHAESKVWLVKVPHFVAKRWRAAIRSAGSEGAANGSKGVELGKLVLQQLPDKKRQYSLVVEGAQDMPTNFAMESQDRQLQLMHVFSTAPNKRQCVEGMVGQRLDARPQLTEATHVTGNVTLDPSYSKVARQSREALDQRTKGTGIKQLPDRLTRFKPPQLLPGKVGLYRKQAEIVAQHRSRAQKRDRLAQPDLQRLLFTLFERQQYWTFSGLGRETQQPHTYLKEVLAEVAVLNKKGPHREQWQLKEEYRTAGGPVEVPDGSGEGDADMKD